MQNEVGATSRQAGEWQWVKKMRVCNDASHEKGLERDADKLMNCWLILIHYPPSQSLQLELL